MIITIPIWFGLRRRRAIGCRGVMVMGELIAVHDDLYMCQLDLPELHLAHLTREDEESGKLQAEAGSATFLGFVYILESSSSSPQRHPSEATPKPHPLRLWGCKE